MAEKQKEDALEVEGVVTQALANTRFRVTIEGAVLTTGNVTNSASEYDLINTNNINLSGTQATSVSLRQPYSQVQLPAATSLSSPRPISCMIPFIFCAPWLMPIANTRNGTRIE